MNRLDASRRLKPSPAMATASAQPSKCVDQTSSTPYSRRFSRTCATPPGRTLSYDRVPTPARHGGVGTRHMSEPA